MLPFRMAFSLWRNEKSGGRWILKLDNLPTFVESLKAMVGANR